MPGHRRRKHATSQHSQRPDARSQTPAVAAVATSTLTPALLAAIIALLVYLPAAWNGFTNWDDIAYIHNNPHMTAPDGLARIWTTNESPQYYPLTFTTFWLEHNLWGLHPVGYHLVNVTLHGINAGLVVCLLSIFGLRPWQGFAVALLFALSPVQVMSVGWVAELKNLLSTSFGLLTLILLCRHFASPSKTQYLLAIATFLLTLLSKSAWLVLPFVAAAAGVLILKRPWRRILLAIAPMVVIAALSAVATVLMERQYQGAPPPALMQRLLIAPGALMFYFQKALIPIGLSPFYPRWHVPLTEVASWVPAILIVATIAILITLRRRLNPIAAWGIAAFVLFLTPVLGVVPFGNMDVTWVSDHFLYYAVIGIYTALVVTVTRLLSGVAPGHGRAAGAFLATVAAVAAAVLTIRQIPVWKDAESMWTRAAKFNPNNYVPFAGLAMAHVGDHDFDKAALEFRRAVELHPADADTRTRYAATLLQLGRWDEASAQLERAVADDPKSAPALLNLGVIAEYRNNPALAADRYRAVLAIDPDQKDAMIRLAAILATTQDPALRDPQTAFQLAERLNKLMARPSAGSLDVLGMACAANGQFDRAVQLTERAAAIAEQAGNDAQRNALRQRIDLYRAGRPYTR